MDNARLVNKWHKKIIGICEQRLGRMLFDQERQFIQSIGSFVALEMIEDSVSTMPADALIEYLKSEGGR